MSEHLKSSQEHKFDNLDLPPEVKKSLEITPKEAGETKHDQIETSELINKVEQQAVSSKETAISEKEVASAQEFGVYADMKAQTYARTLGRIRGRLSKPNQVMSKIMHNNVVDTISNSVSKTVARPSGILGGGIVALAGSSVLLYMAKHYGFKYNFFSFFILLAGGFVLGLLVELLVRTAIRIKR